MNKSSVGGVLYDKISLTDDQFQNNVVFTVKSMTFQILWGYYYFNCQILFF